MKKNYGISYRYQEYRVTESNCFEYEINIYKIEKNCVSIIDSKFYKYKNLLNLKTDEIILKKTKDYSIVKMIDLVGVPKEFIEENNLVIYEPKKPIKKVITKKVILKKKKRK